MRPRLLLHLITFNVVAFFIFAMVRFSSAIDGRIDIPSFKKTAVKKWNETFDVTDNYEYTEVIRHVEDGTIVKENSSHVAVMFPCSYIEREEDDHTRFSVECHNSKYGFSLFKEEGSPDWQINYVHKYDHELRRKRDWHMRHYASYFLKKDRLVKHYSDEEIDCGLYFMVNSSSIWGQLNPSYLLPCLITDPDFTITSVTEIVNEAGVPCYNVEFTYKSGSEHNLFNVREGRIELDRTDFTIQHAVYNWGSPEYDGIKDVTISYAKNDSAPFPLVTKIVTKDIENGKLRFTEEIDYEFRPVSNLTEDRFKLSYYGFKEPIFEEDSTLDSRWYFLGAGIVFIALAAIIGRRRKRVRETSMESSEDVVA